MRPAPPDSWRVYNESSPDPGYFEFDWLSARHPDLYHNFALSTDGLMHELEKLVDLTGLTVADVGAGTGRATVIAARKAKVVFAIDAYESVAAFGKRNAEAARLENVNYIIGDIENLPLENNSVDAVICAWAKLDYGEVYRVLRHNGYLIQLNCAPGSQCGELTATLAESYPGLITEVAPRAQFERFCPSVDSVAQDTNWNGVPLVSPMKRHDFTYVAEYGSIRDVWKTLRSPRQEVHPRQPKGRSSLASTHLLRKSQQTASIAAHRPSREPLLRLKPVVTSRPRASVGRQ
jgi:SAM-dependent methyltransferase